MVCCFWLCETSSRHVTKNGTLYEPKLPLVKRTGSIPGRSRDFFLAITYRNLGTSIFCPLDIGGALFSGIKQTSREAGLEKVLTI
jgi:hypothetical protein